MDTFLIPIKTLVDINVRTKSTYRAALEGIDLSMDKILNDLQYEHQEPIGLYLQPADQRLSYAKDKLSKCTADPRAGIEEFVKHCSTILNGFFNRVYIGKLRDLDLEGGLLKVKLSCLLHSSFGDNAISKMKIFQEQLDYLKSIDLTPEKSAKTIEGLQFKNNEHNCKIITDILSQRSARLIDIRVFNGYIREINFSLKVQDISLFATNEQYQNIPVDDKIINDDEMVKLRRILSEIPASLQLAAANESMRNTCCNVAEGYFADLCDMVNFTGVIAKRVHKRHEKQRNANLSIHEIEDQIGKSFPAAKASETMTLLQENLMRFCIANLHCVAREVKINMWHGCRFELDWVSCTDDFCYYTENEDIDVPDRATICDVLNIYTDEYDRIHLLDTDHNKHMCQKLLGGSDLMEIDSFVVEKIHNNEVYVIKKIGVSLRDIGHMIKN